MIILHKEKLVYVHAPKTAGSATTKALREQMGIPIRHYPEEQLARGRGGLFVAKAHYPLREAVRMGLVDDSFTAMMVTRRPQERAISLACFTADQLKDHSFLDVEDAIRRGRLLRGAERVCRGFGASMRWMLRGEEGLRMPEVKLFKFEDGLQPLIELIRSRGFNLPGIPFFNKNPLKPQQTELSPAAEAKLLRWWGPEEWTDFGYNPPTP